MEGRERVVMIPKSHFRGFRFLGKWGMGRGRKTLPQIDLDWRDRVLSPLLLRGVLGFEFWLGSGKGFPSSQFVWV